MINTIKTLKETKVNIYESISNSSRPWYDTSIFNFLTTKSRKEKAKIEYLRQLNKEDESKAKKYKKENLLCCTISATFDSIRKVRLVKEYTGIICIDIDKKDNPFMEAEKAKQDVMKLPYVMLASLSCRGNGIYCMIPYNKENKIYEVYNSLHDEFKRIGYNIDDSCSDPTRLRVISYDNNILLKQEVEMYEGFKKEKERPSYELIDEWELNKDDLKDLTIIIYVLTKYNGYTSDEYNDWLLDGFRLATIPNREIGLNLFRMISEASDNYTSDEDVENKFNECRNTTTYKTNILGYYFNKIKEIYGNDWRYRVNDILKEKPT